MSGVARSESSQVLCITIVFFPPMKISEVYSSMARFESPTYGTLVERERNGLVRLERTAAALDLDGALTI